MYELARKWMAKSKSQKLPGHISKATNLALWKRFREYWAQCWYNCSVLQYNIGLPVLEGPGWMQLDLCCKHHVESHDADASKNLKHEQIIAVADGVPMAQLQ